MEFFELSHPQVQDGAQPMPAVLSIPLLRFCHAFKAMTPDERYESARVHRYCVNCLATSHKTGACDSADSCHRCGKAHHTLLHRSTSPPPERRRHEPPPVVSRRRPTHGSRVAKKSVPDHGRNNVQRRIRELFSKAVLTLEKLQELLHLSPVQAGRHVEDMSHNLIEF